MRTRSIVLSLASLTLLGSCDHRAFDDLKDQVWVRADSKPSDPSSTGFAVGLIGTGGADYQYFVASKSPPLLFLATIDEDGSRAVGEAANPQGLNLTPEPFPTPVVLAVDPSGFGEDDGNVAAGILADTPMLYMVRSDGQAGPPIELEGAVSPTGIAFGDTDGSAQVDLFAVSGEELNIIENYKGRGDADPDPNDVIGSCGLGDAATDVHVADVGAAAGDEVLVAVAGEVRVTTGSALGTAATDETGCFEVVPAAATIAAPDGEASFGTLIRRGDFDGNGDPDLVIAAPGEDAVYVFLNWTVEAPSTGTRITTPSGASSFGSAVATGDFGGDGRDELVVSDPGIDVDSNESAGSVFIYEPNGSGEFGEAIVLHDADPEADQVFGQSLTIVQAFGGARLVVGAKDEVFSYFRTPISGDVDFTE